MTRRLLRVAAASICAAALLAQGPPYKSVSFKTGKLEFKLEGDVYSANLDAVGTNLDFYKVFGKDEQSAGASYTSPKGAENRAVVRFAIVNVHGPGKYVKKDIQNFVVGWGPIHVWNFNGRQDDCTFTFSRLDEGGMEGTVSCSGGQAPAFTEMKLRAAP